MARGLVFAPKTAKRGEVIEVRVVVQHPMETGHRSDAEGRIVPRDIVTRIECSWNGERVFAATLYPAVSANPTVAFPVVAAAGGSLVVTWSGDNGFAHVERLTVDVSG